MEEPQSSQINNEDGEELYEKIEAPKFVDFTVPDLCSPDDRYWFCLRVGCDQKHEEEMDPDVIYKNFVLRVMAARSPNLRLRKALNRKASSTNVKCPHSAPAKSLKSRGSRLAVSSISQKIVDVKAKVRPLPKLCSTPNAKGKQSSVAAKYLTTPRIKKCLPNPDPFRSVRNPKGTSIAVPKNRVVAKALVFHSPKKAVRTKTSLELQTPISKICSGMKKLEITSQRKRALGYSNKSSKNIRCAPNKSLPSYPSKRQLGACKDKTRAEDSLHPKKCNGLEAKSSRCLKRESNGNLQKYRGSVPHETVENDSSDMEIDEKSRDGSLEVCIVWGSSKSSEGNGHEKCPTTVKNSGNFGYTNNTLEEAISSFERPSSGEKLDAMLSDVSRSDVNSLSHSEQEENDFPKSQPLSEEGDEGNEGSKEGEKIKLTSEKGKIPNDCPPEYQTSKGEGHDSKVMESDDKENASASDHESDDKENASASDDKENASASDDKEHESDDKENASASDDNRELNLNNDLSARKILGSHETCENTKKITRVPKKTSKENFISAVTGGQGMKYKKPKPTNPKPFRLRTDERGILKEANLERRLHLLAPLKETSTPRFPSANSQRRHGNEVRRNEKCIGQSKYETDRHEGSEKETEKITQNQPQRIKSACMKTSKRQVEPKTGAITPQRRTISMHQKPNFATSPLDCSNDNAAQKLENSLKKTKSASLRQLVRPHGVTSTRKAIVSLITPIQLSVINETSRRISRPKEAVKPSESGDTPATKASASSSSRSLSQGRRRPATIPKEPNFHSIHVPKSCTRKLA